LNLLYHKYDGDLLVARGAGGGFLWDGKPVFIPESIFLPIAQFIIKYYVYIEYYRVEYF